MKVAVVGATGLVGTRMLEVLAGITPTTFNPEGTMTRGMFVTVLGRYAGVDPDDYEDRYQPELYSDVIADAYYAPYVNWATRYGLTSGTGVGTFDPNKPITREQMAVFLLRFANCYGYLFQKIQDKVPASFTDKGKISSYAVEAVETMRACGLLTGRLNDNGTYRFDPKANATRAECAAVFHRMKSALVPDEDSYIGYDGESYASKCKHVFGKVVDNHRRPYGDDAPKSVYKENMVEVTVKVWDFKDKNRTKKITKTITFEIHKNLAQTVMRCFQEIYECPEQYPINSIISYWSDSGNSEHNPGTAIDINYESNPYVDPNGKVITGKKFDPKNDPYSLPVDGEVQQIFEKYGFTRGIYWKSGYKDYMHFSFFGT